MFKRILLTGLLFCLPLSVNAEERIQWNFEGETPGQWTVRNLTSADQTPQGVLIQTTKDGFMTINTEFRKSIEAVDITLQSNQSMEMVLLWKDPTLAIDGYVQLPFIVNGSPDTQTISIDLSNFDHWHSQATEFGIGVPAGAMILLQDISLYNWNLAEQAWHGFLSFWKFDTCRSFSINFLWGPLLTFNPIAREDIHINNPPLGHSGMWVFYTILIVGALWFLWRFKMKNVQTALTSFLLLCACLWVVNDVRMGAELLSYARNDWRDHIFKGVGERTFRSHLNFPDVVDQSAAYIADDPYYIFMGPLDTTVYFSIMRYLTYPRLPVSGGDHADTVTHAITFGRNADIDDEGNLRVDDEIVRKGSGSLLRRLGKFGSLYQFK